MAFRYDAGGDAYINEVSDALFDQLVDFCILNECFVAHRRVSMMRENKPAERAVSPEKTEKPVIRPHFNRHKQLECMCPMCARNIAAVRFAPHLEKCYGGGRRAARNTMQSYNEKGPGSVHSHPSDEEYSVRSESDGDDWNVRKPRKKTKGKKRK